MSAHPDAPGDAPIRTAPLGRILSTLNEDGTRRRIRPRFARGLWFARRRVTAYALMLVFFAIPYLRMGGKPVILLDLPRREFTFFGTTFLASETLLFLLLLLSFVLGIFFVTALWGRVWCGWACPQTVYMEFLFRPIEYALEKGPRGSKKMDRTRGPHRARVLKQGIFLLLSLFLAHTFLAYFVGVEELAKWVQRSPVHHPTSFAIMLITTLAVFADFAWFREQTCLVACPYGRLQSVLLDRRSLLVGYDARRGEPRHRGVVDRPEGVGDCLMCAQCILACPTGIDIRDGLQMECIHCTQCVDACDAEMARVGKPPGLIRYGSQEEFEGRRRSWVRPRVLLYPAALAVAFLALVWQLGTRADAEVTLLRGLGEPYTIQADGSVANQVRIKVANRGRTDRAYRIGLEGVGQASIIAPINPLPVPAGESRTTSVFVLLPASAFRGGEHLARVSLSDGAGFALTRPYRLVGPEESGDGGPGERGPAEAEDK